MRLGGPADLFYEARDAEELEIAMRLARQCAIPYFLLGLGANVIIGDLGFRGLVIRNCARGMRVLSAGNQIWTESGAIMYPGRHRPSGSGAALGPRALRGHSVHRRRCSLAEPALSGAGPEAHHVYRRSVAER